MYAFSLSPGKTPSSQAAIFGLFLFKPAPFPLPLQTTDPGIPPPSTTSFVDGVHPPFAPASIAITSSEGLLRRLLITWVRQAGTGVVLMRSEAVVLASVRWTGGHY